MKSLLFYAVVVALIIGGCILLLKKLDIEIFGNTILPQEEWADILPGKWAFEVKFNSFKEIYIFEGEMKYFPDGTFNKYVSMKNYYGITDKKIVKGTYRNLCIEGGGSYSGTWSVGNGLFWNEIVKKCSMNTTFAGEDCDNAYNICDWFPEKDSISYGTMSDSLSMKQIKVFSKNKIIIEGKKFSNDSTRKWIFRKID